MFERYTEKARHIIFFARDEASQTASHSIETEHLLLGLLREAKPLFEKVNVEEMTKELRGAVHVERAGEADVAADLPLSQSAKHVLMCAMREAEHLKHGHVCPEHILLALLREPGFAARTLEKYGVHRDRIVFTLRQDLDIEMKSKSRDLIHELERAFAPLVEHLTPEVEPAVLYTANPEISS
jgi:ATP-dependent Clp protease ATP-binding subunit ClpC